MVTYAIKISFNERTFAIVLKLYRLTEELTQTISYLQHSFQRALQALEDKCRLLFKQSLAPIGVSCQMFTRLLGQHFSALADNQYVDRIVCKII